MLALAVRFPLGTYHAQSQSDFGRAEWPPHPVRLIAALVAAAHGGDAASVTASRRVVDRLAHAAAPVIVAPQRDRPEDGARADAPRVAEIRGASRWAPRNHELGELKSGISPRDLGRGRAEVHKVGVAIGDQPVIFVWPDLELDAAETTTLARVAEDVTVLGTSRSPVLVEVRTGALPDAAADAAKAAWRPQDDTTRAALGAAAVRVPDGRTLGQLDAWHARRSVAVDRSGAPAKAPLVVAPRIGAVVSYVHDRAIPPPGPLDPAHWGDMLVVRIDGDVIPKAPAAFALARAMRKALLDTYGTAGQAGDAPAVLRGRGCDPHAAFVPLSFVAPTDGGPAAQHADGRVLGVAVILPHASRLGTPPGAALERDAVVEGLMRLVAGVGIRVPGVGPVRVVPVPVGMRVPLTLQDERYRRPSSRWTTVTPLVHSRYRSGKTPEALLRQVSAECHDVGLPAPVQVRLRRGSRLRGAPGRIARAGLPKGWTGPLEGPQAHLDLWFDREVHGPVLLGRARHFGLGLCLPFDDDAGEAVA